MLGLLLVGFGMALMSVWFWYLEVKGFLDSVEGYQWWATPFIAIGNIWRLIPFVLDIAITLFCVANLGFGGGVLGGITGLFISNCISIIIVLRTKGKKKYKLA